MSTNTTAHLQLAISDRLCQILIKLVTYDASVKFAERLADDVLVFCQTLQQSLPAEDYTGRAHAAEAVRYASQLVSVLRTSQSVTVGESLCQVVTSQISLLRGMLRHVS